LTIKKRDIFKGRKQKLAALLFDGFVKSSISVLRLALTVAPIGLKNRTACHPSSVPCSEAKRYP